MDFKVLLKLGIVTGVLLNAFDVIVQGLLMAGMYTAPVFRKPEEEIVYLVLTDFAAAFAFVWVYLKLGSATGPGVAGGATFGFYAGVLYSFPMFYAMHDTTRFSPRILHFSANSSHCRRFLEQIRPFWNQHSPSDISERRW